MKKCFQYLIVLLLLLTTSFCKAQNWCVLPATPNSYGVECLKTYRNRLIVGGNFYYCGSLSALGQAAWNGQYWDTIGQCCPIANYPCYLEIIDNKLYFASIYQDKVYKWNDTIFTPISSIYPLLTGITSIKSFKNDIYISGPFYQLSNNLIVSCIARFHNGVWYSVSGGVSNFATQLKCMAVFKNELYVGGLFGKAGNVLTNHIARWNGNNWADVGGGLPASGMVHTMEVDTINDFLYVAGSFDHVGQNPSIPALLIARWDGYKWESLGNIVDNAIYCLEFYNNQLYAGWAASNNLITDTLLAKFDGKNFQYFTGPNSYLYAMEVYKDTLYIGGSFTRVSQYLTSNLVGLYEPPPTHCNWLISRIYTNNDTITLGDTIHFENNNRYATSWAWDFGDGGFDSVQKPNHVYQTSGVYTTSVIVHQENCYDTAYFTVNVQQVDAVNNTKQKEYMLGNNIPNPFTNSTIIPYQIPQGKQGFIIITDINSKEIARYTLKEPTGNLEVSTQGWQAGVYTYSLYVNGKVLQSKQMSLIK